MNRPSEVFWVSPGQGPPRRAALLSLAGLLPYAAVAVMVSWGLRVASLALEWKRAPQPGFTPSVALELAAILPGIVVLLAYWRLGQALQRPSLSNSAAWTFGSSWALTLVAAPLTKAGDDIEAILGLLVILSVLVSLGCSIWFDISLLKLRGELGPLGGWLGALGLLDSAIWVLFKALLIAGVASAAGQQPDADTDQLFDQVRPLDRADMVRALVSRTILSTLTIGLFMSLSQRLTAENEKQPGGGLS